MTTRPPGSAAAAAVRVPPSPRPGAHTPAGGAHSHTHAPEGSAAAAAATRAGSGAEGRGGGARPPEGRRPITSPGSRRPEQVFTPGRRKLKGSGQGPGERGYERVGTRAPGREAETKGSEESARETPERGLGPARTPPGGRRGRPDRPLRPAPRCPGAQRVSAGPTPWERAGEERERFFSSWSRANTSVFVFFAELGSGLPPELSVVALVAPRPGPCPVGRQPGIVRKREPLLARLSYPQPLAHLEKKRLCRPLASVTPRWASLYRKQLLFYLGVVVGWRLKWDKTRQHLGTGQQPL